MHYCPYCGTIVRKDEHFCLKCGKELPVEIEKRQLTEKVFNPYWYIPIFTAILIILSLVTYNLFLENRSKQARELYDQGEISLLNEDYNEAYELITEAHHYKKNFYEADIALEFIKHAIQIEDILVEADTLQNDLQFNDALALVNQAENTLKNYHGEAASLAINHINESRNNIKIIQLTDLLENSPNIGDLKNLLWEAETIKTNEAKEITTAIEKQIVDYTFSKASEIFNNKQFNDALLLVEDGLKYVPTSEKLQSLKTTIDKEQTAFEIAEQQRIEQAINIANEEYELNKLDAINLKFVKLELNDQDKLVVKGEVESVATIPINSILIEYTLSDKKGKEILTNKVFVFPDKLYPDETGKFEFTHYDITRKIDDIKVDVNKITWYTD